MTADRKRPDLTRLLNPGCIAVFGGRWAERVVAQCRKLGFAGEVWPVHPSRETIAGMACFRSVEDLPRAPDASFIAVNRHQSIEIVRALARSGAGGAVCFASGFKEVGAAGAALQDQLIAAARDMPILGPNCYGLINYVDGALLWPDQQGGERTERGVAILMQSGNMAVNMTMNRRGVPIAYLAALGNQAKVGLSELIEAMAGTGRVSVIGLLIEGVGDVRRFAAAVQTARGLGVPVVALKTGRSEKGAQLAITHTGSLAGGDDVMDALFRRIGVARVHSLPILLETLKLLHVHGPLPGNTLVTMSCSGGEALLISDAAEGLEVEFPKLSEADEARIRPTVQPLVNLSNPFDYHTFDWGNRERLAATFGAVMECGFDLNLLVADLPREDRVEPSDWQIGVEAFAGAAEKIGARAGVLATLHECMPEERALELMARGVVPLLGIDEALQAVEAAAFLGRGTSDPFEPLGQVSAAPTNTHTLTEWEAKQHLASYGVPIPEGRLCYIGDDVAAAVAELGFPVVAKAVGRDVVHKSEMGAVRLNLDGLDHVAAAFGELRSLGDAVLLERMAPRPVAELIIGVSVDPVAGPYMVVGSGGVLAELVRDTRVIVLPTSPDEVRTAIGALGASRLLEGYRGQAKGDIEAVIDTAMAIARWVGDYHQGLVSLDVNPLMVAREGDGALAVDALIELRED